MDFPSLLSAMESRETIRVAVVDDDESLCRSLSRLLRASGFAPFSFSSAEDFLRAEPNAFDCLVLDIQLGVFSGLDLQQFLLDAGRTTPVVIITAHDDPAVRHRAVEAGCAGYFKKTDPGHDVIACIRDAVAHHTGI